MTNKLALSGFTFLAAVTLIGLSSVQRIAAAETVSVTLASGRHFTAQIDSRTDEQHLWLRFGERSVKLLRPIRWDRIRAAEHKEQILTAEELKTLATSIDHATSLQTRVAEQDSFFDKTQQGSSHERLANWVHDIQATRAAAGDAASVDTMTMADVARWAVASENRVHSVQFDAWLSNWDGDVEADGLILNIIPLDNHGGIVAVDATVTVELFAPVASKFHEAPHDRGQSVREIARWTELVSAGEIGPAGAQLRFPFQTMHPEFDSRVGNHGLVHLRLAVAGHGVFEHSLDGIRIQPFAPLRDHLERSVGQRFLPTERTGH